MGQYHTVFNLTKKEFIKSHNMDSGAKLLEQVGWDCSPSTALFLLLACSNGRGGGDAMDHELVGSWAGDKIAIIGDYANHDDIDGIDAADIYGNRDEYTDISTECLKMVRMNFE